MITQNPENRRFPKEKSHRIAEMAVKKKSQPGSLMESGQQAVPNQEGSEPWRHSAKRKVEPLEALTGSAS